MAMALIDSTDCRETFQQAIPPVRPEVDDDRSPSPSSPARLECGLGLRGISLSLSTTVGWGRSEPLASRSFACLRLFARGLTSSSLRLGFPARATEIRRFGGAARRVSLATPRLQVECPLIWRWSSMVMDFKLYGPPKPDKFKKRDRKEDQDSSNYIQSCNEDGKIDTKDVKHLRPPKDSEVDSGSGGKVNIPEFIEDISHGEDDMINDEEMDDVLLRLEHEDQFGEEGKSEVDEEVKTHLGKGKQIVDEDLHLAIDPVDPHINLPHSVIPQTDSPIAGLLDSKAVKAPEKKKTRKKEPAVAQKFSTRIKRDGIPITVKAQPRVNHMNDLSGYLKSTVAETLEIHRRLFRRSLRGGELDG
ncbi:hypothetical protein GUJ93_ZPchr0014g46695 [Zizania palustris]|uniref:Uncharacterized protein n=1 Tax=Zizania palustris TaxID=103762 RepID=A0A8J5W5P1_ZIZPA|nr:hypothetical protein GUJ93_ZPchr0014g46695 [Zizania palustris]